MTASQASTPRTGRMLSGRIKLFIWGTYRPTEGGSRSTPDTIEIMEYQPPRRNENPAHHLESLVKPWYAFGDSQASSATTPVEEHYFLSVWQRLEGFMSCACDHDAKPLLISHCMAFDTNFLLGELERARIPVPSWRFASSKKLVKDVMLSSPSGDSQYSLEELAERFGVSFEPSQNTSRNIRILRDILEHIEDTIHLDGTRPSMAETLWKDSVRLDEFSEYFPLHPVRQETSVPPLHTLTVSTTTESPCFTTRNGRYYHRDSACASLRRERGKIPISGIPPHLDPCPRCCRDGISEHLESVGTISAAYIPSTEHEEIRTCRHSAGKVRSRPRQSFAKYIITKTGRLYHVDEYCRGLRSAKTKIGVQLPRSGLTPCQWCCNVNEEESSATEHTTATTEYAVNESSSNCPTKASCLAPYGEDFYNTPSGTKFHVDRQCRHLKNRVVLSCAPETDSKDPCRTCSLDLFRKWKSAGFARG